MGAVFAAGLLLAADEDPEARLFKSGAAPMKGDNGKWGFRSPGGGWLVEPKFAEVKNFSEELAAVREGASWGYLGTDGNWKIPARFSWAGDFNEGLAPASEGDRLTGKFGYIDHQGRWAIEAEYDWARPFQEGFGGVKDGSKWGFVDKKGKQVVEPDFDQVGFFSGGLVPVQKSGAPGEKETWSYIKPDGTRPFEKNTPGRELFPTDWQGFKSRIGSPGSSATSTPRVSWLFSLILKKPPIFEMVRRQSVSMARAAPSTKKEIRSTDPSQFFCAQTGVNLGLSLRPVSRRIPPRLAA